MWTIFFLASILTTVTILPVGASELSVSDLTLSQGDTGTIEISLVNEMPIAGFQFNVSDNPDLLTYVNVSGTERTEVFTISANELENEVITLGFSFSGDVIASGSGPIVVIEYEATGGEGESVISLSNITLSDSNGNQVPSISMSGLATITDVQVQGCTDSIACNYNPDATLDDGTCDFESCAGCTDENASNFNSDADPNSKSNSNSDSNTLDNLVLYHACKPYERLAGLNMGE